MLRMRVRSCRALVVFTGLIFITSTMYSVNLLPTTRKLISTSQLERFLADIELLRYAPIFAKHEVEPFPSTASCSSQVTFGNLASLDMGTLRAMEIPIGPALTILDAVAERRLTPGPRDVKAQGRPPVRPMLAASKQLTPPKSAATTTLTYGSDTNLNDVLCFSLLSAHSTSSTARFKQNFFRTSNYCDWALVLDEENSSITVDNFVLSVVGLTVDTTRLRIISAQENSAALIGFPGDPLPEARQALSPLAWLQLVKRHGFLLSQYRFVHLVDQGVSLQSFDGPKFLRAVCSQSPLIAHPVWEHGNPVPLMNSEYWSDTDESVVLVETSLVDQLSPLVATHFLQWFVEHGLLPQTALLYNTMAGPSKVWCGAARQFLRQVMGLSQVDAQHKVTCAVTPHVAVSIAPPLASTSHDDNITRVYANVFPIWNAETVGSGRKCNAACVGRQFSVSINDADTCGIRGVVAPTTSYVSMRAALNAHMAASAADRRRQNLGNSVLCMTFVGVPDPTRIPVLKHNVLRHTDGFCDWVFMTYTKSALQWKSIDWVDAALESGRIRFIEDLRPLHELLWTSEPIAPEVHLSDSKLFAWAQLARFHSGTLDLYAYAWFVDDDISFKGVDTRKFLTSLLCSIEEGPPLIVTLPLRQSQGKLYRTLDARHWQVYFDLVRVKPKMVEVMIVEAGAPLMFVPYFKWLVDHVMLRQLSYVYSSMWGTDFCWCLAGLHFLLHELNIPEEAAKASYSCALAPAMSLTHHDHQSMDKLHENGEEMLIFTELAFPFWSAPKPFLHDFLPMRFAEQKLQRCELWGDFNFSLTDA